MKAGEETISVDAHGWRILLVGDVNRAFVDPEEVIDKGCEICTNILDAIGTTTRGRFAAIGVVMSGTSARLRQALKALKDNCDAKIILLAQMSEEPRAVQLAGSRFNGACIADDYLICPIRFSHLVSRVVRLVTGSVVGHVPEAAAAGSDETGAPASAAAGEEVRRKIAVLERLATEDDLTGLKNRRYIWEFSRQIMERARRTKGRVTLLVFDIDNFKHYNDVYGHSAGDTVLKQAAVLMRRCCRRHDVVGRIGGDEFAVVFWDDPRLKPAGTEPERRSATADHPKEAIFIAKRFLKELERAELNLLGPEGRGSLTISGALASFPRDGSTIEELFRQADQALLDAKRSGKNRIHLVGRPQGDIADIE
jgi:diguanylate cyclase (GGDEF)-like protein